MRIHFLVIMAFAIVPAAAQDAPIVVPLWPQGSVPGSIGDDPNLDVPTITVYRPSSAKATGAVVVVCPGGGYGHLAMDHEGKQVADWLNEIGVAAAVLKYRLAPDIGTPP